MSLSLEVFTFSREIKMCYICGGIFDIFSRKWVENGDQLETITMSPGMHQMMIQGGPGQEPQLVQVVSLKDATLLSKAMEAINSGNVKSEDTIIMEQ
ncbi:DNA-binding protein Ewg-like [Drosophila teissieri]|uniref:DNA-binding protein Ewg-like n=1 Tax=Drosophila teissieri TaxID=7243 RepID=UPI001CB9D829|nr:DNA-binding protein Ewg-like [Drosophila teissieri]